MQQILSNERENKILYSTVNILPAIWAGYRRYFPLLSTKCALPQVVLNQVRIFYLHSLKSHSLKCEPQRAPATSPLTTQPITTGDEVA